MNSSCNWVSLFRLVRVNSRHVNKPLVFRVRVLVYSGADEGGKCPTFDDGDARVYSEIVWRGGRRGARHWQSDQRVTSMD